LSEKPAKPKPWQLYLYPSFEEILHKLFLEVDELRKEKPDEHASHLKSKLLKRVLELITKEIPVDPAAPRFVLGKTLAQKKVIGGA
jgi:toxin YhaV